MDSAKQKLPKIGDVYLVSFGGTDSEQRGIRPGLIIQNNTGNYHSPNVIVVPLTTAIKKMNQPTHVLIRSADTGLVKDSVVLCENPQQMSKSKLGVYLTTLPNEYMIKIAKAYVLSTSVISFLDLDTLGKLWNKSVELNSVGL